MKLSSCFIYLCFVVKVASDAVESVGGEHAVSENAILLERLERLERIFNSTHVNVDSKIQPSSH